VQRTTDLAEVLDRIPGLVVVLTADGTLEFINRRVQEYFGLTLEQLKGWITSDAIHPDDLSQTISTLRNAIKTGQPYKLDHRLRRHDGAYRWFHDDGVPIQDADGRIVNWYVLFTDVHERRIAEEALRRSEESLHEAQTLSHTGSWKYVLSGSITVTPEMARIFGVDSGEHTLGTEYFFNRFHPEDRERVRHLFERSVTQKTDFQADYRIVLPDGATIRHLHTVGHPIVNESGELIEFFGTTVDVTGHWEARAELERALEELRRSEESLLEAQRLSHTGSYKYDGLSGKITASPELARIFGVNSVDDAFNTEFFFSKFHPEDRERVEKLFEQSLMRKVDFQTDYRIVLPDRTIRHHQTHARAVVNESGEMVGFIGTAVDDTEQWRAKAELERALEELQRSEESLHEAQKLSHTGSWEHDLLSGATRVTPEMGRIFGADPGDDLSNNQYFINRFHEEDRNQVQRLFGRSMTGKADFQTDYRIVLPDGTIRHLHTIAHRVENGSGDLVKVFGTTMDVTEHWEANAELERALEEIKRLRDRLQDENLALREEIIRSSMFEEIVGSSQPLRKVLEEVARVAPTDSTVLISGETGTGKELIARAIHKRSNRSSRAFISVNCGAIPQSLIASELFGYEKGAFTGAMQRRIGRFEAANGGTIFLDEVGELPMETQVALLRVLQEREFERIGGSERLQVDVRVLAATNRDLKGAVSSGAFRADLFYRLNVFPIEMPPLRERAGDIPMLVQYLIDRYGKRVGKKFTDISMKTLALFQKYDWPGNIRELQNVVERAVIVCDGSSFSIDDTWLKTELSPAPAAAFPLSATPSDGEKELIEKALAQCRGRVSGASGAAVKLGIPRQTLESKILRLGINKHQFRN
jgi:PAS domain S-box-containing protein